MPATGGSALFVSDSSLAVIRWNGQLGSLQGANITADLESCRRLIGVSCRGREGYAPTTAATRRGHRRPAPSTPLVINVGYNDFSSTFASGFDAVVAAARSRGIPRIVWLDLSGDGRIPGAARTPSNPENYAVYNATVAVVRRQRPVPGGRDRRLERLHRHAPRLAERRRRTRHDGRERRAAGEYVSRTLAFLDRRAVPGRRSADQSLPAVGAPRPTSPARTAEPAPGAAAISRR